MKPADMRGLWRLLGQTWGARFVEQYGTDPNDAWVAMLTEIDTEAARGAYRALVLSGSPHPPTLPEFLADARKFARDRAIAQRNEQALLPPPQRTTPEKARENAERIRRMLNS
jgi:hypothetical protein